MPEDTRNKNPLAHGPEWAAIHDSLRADNEAWRGCAFGGIQPGGDGEVYELRHCPGCGSSLLRPISRAEAFKLMHAMLQTLTQTAGALTGGG